jgi:hypothetical protein
MRALRTFLRPLLTRLAHQLDVRLVRTLRDAVEALLRLRDRHGLRRRELRL